MEAEYLRNRRAWDGESDAYERRHGAQLARSPMAWGVWSIPEAELRLLGDVAGRDVLEYGCGAARWSIALAALGARCTGLDNSRRQLDHARANVAAAGADVRLVHGAAEAPPFGDAAFDAVFCDHGAMSFAAPETTVPQIARLLRPGGVLAFSLGHPLREVFWDERADAVSRTAHRPYFDVRPLEDARDGGVSHVRPVSTYVMLLIEHGFVIEKLLEPRPSTEAVTSYEGYADLAWARDLPLELMIRARRAGLAAAASG